MKYTMNTGIILNWLFGIAVFVNGILNLFWGNDPGLGVAFLLLSLVYLPPATDFIKTNFGLTIPASVKIILAIIILWVTGAVGAISEGYVF